MQKAKLPGSSTSAFPTFFGERKHSTVICNALAIYGKWFRDADLKEICIEAEIVAEGSIMDSVIVR